MTRRPPCHELILERTGSRRRSYSAHSASSSVYGSSATNVRLDISEARGDRRVTKVAADSADERLRLREKRLEGLVRSNAGPEVYDEWCRALESRHKLDTAGCVEFLAELAAGRQVLELAIGTGRIALPLACRGLEVHGIDVNPKMVEALRAKPGGERIPVTVGDLTDVPVDGTFGLVFIVFNTFWYLPSLEAQSRCVSAVAQRLTNGGAFVIETPYAALKAFAASGTRYVKKFELDELTCLDIATHDATSQRVEHQHVLLRRDGVEVVSGYANCYVFVEQLDEMAAAAGLQLVERWGGWRREPLEDGSRNVVSVYRRAGGTASEIAGSGTAGAVPDPREEVGPIAHEGGSP